ncbi:replication protein A 70 kDa DNA-binding subunit [Sitophilus oryzae]|uniref:Replication protein A subunit n=1 Tax=Sitophilus oryzae TaxID=7048 RepID=A0A6J2XQP0_SITOR|nr:replication protein A 70 kDa DNA-binding subunit [Sitophilus oryzae]
MKIDLSEGCFKVIMTGGEVQEPIVQVVTLKKMSTASGQERYRACLSDGKYMITVAMITAPVVDKTSEKGIPKYSVIKLKRYITTVINNTNTSNNKADGGRVLLMLDVELVQDGDEIGEVIGNPVSYSVATAQETREGSPPAKMRKLNGPSNSSNTNGESSHQDLNKSMAGQMTHPITCLNPYNNKWIIKARVISKTPIKTWSNSRGEGKLFSMDLVDESGEIRLTAFRELVDKFYDQIEVDKVYYISKCQLKPANKQFSNLKNDYEMTMVNDTLIEECHDDTSTAPHLRYDFVPIQTIPELETNKIIDVIGVVKSTGDLQFFNAKSTGRELRKKDLILVDKSNAAITLTLWGADAESFDGSNNPVLAIKGARISEFVGGKTLSTLSGTIVKTNPDMKEAYVLKQWFDSEGSYLEANNVSARSAGGSTFVTPWMCCDEVYESQLGSSPAGDYYQMKGAILMVKSDNACYKACPTPECNKKVIDNSNGMYRCEKCNQEYESFKWRLLCSMNVGDWSANQWVSMFSSEAEKVLGKSAEEVGALFESGEPGKYTEFMEEAHFKEFVFKCRAKNEVFNDEGRLKTVAIKVDPVNYTEYNTYLIECIKELTDAS